MNIQIWGRKKCFDTKKAERWFKERRIKVQYIDLDRFGISRGELQSVKNAVGQEALIREDHPDAALLRYLAGEEDKFEHMLEASGPHFLFPIRIKTGDRSVRSPMMCYLFNEAQNQRQYDENDAHPFGHTRECGVQGLGFALGEKCLGAVAGHSSGKTAALSGLEEHNGDEKNAGEQLDYGKDDGESVHEIQPFLLIKKKRSENAHQTRSV